MPTSRPPWPLATSAGGAALLTAVTGALVFRLVDLWPEALAAGRAWPTPGALAIDRLVAVPLLAVGAAVAAWWGLSLVLITVSLLAERAGVHSDTLLRCVHTLAPRTLRRLAAAGVGAGLAFSALPAHAAEAPPDLGWTATQPSADVGLSPRAILEEVPSPLDAATSERGTTATSDLVTPATDLDPPSVPTDPTHLGPLSPEDAPPEAPPPTPRVDQAEKVDTPSPTGGAPRSSAHTPPAERPPGLPAVAGAPDVPAHGGLAPTPADSQHGSTLPSRDRVPSTPAPRVDVSADPSASTVVIAPGDTLWDLAAARLPPEATDAQIAASWHDWYALNAAVIGQDPDLLHPGHVLHVPQAG